MDRDVRNIENLEGALGLLKLEEGIFVSESEG